MSKQFTAALKITSDSADAQKDVHKLGASLQDVGNQGKNSGTELDKNATAVNKLSGTLDAGERNAQKLAAAQATLNSALAAGTINQERHNVLLAQATTRWGAHNDVVAKGGISAGQTAQAMRMLPAQITDITTSLASGMPAWMVLIQQGGQIKDSFGGVGPAFKQLASLVTVARVAMAGSVGAVAAVALAYKQGASEVDAYNKALIMSGNAAGTTAGQLDQMAANVGKVVGTQGAAAEALAQMAGTGEVATANLEQFTTVALDMERSVGIAMSETVKNFSELGKAPMATTLKLNEAYHYLTSAVYEQIKALQLQGREQEAGEVAQKAFADAMGGRTAQIKSNLGVLEKSWITLGDAAKKSWDFMLDIGRQDTPERKFAEIKKRIEDIQFLLANPGLAKNWGGTQALQTELDGLQAQQAPALAEKAKADQAAAEQAKTAKITEEGIKADKDNQKYADAALTKKEQYAKRLETYRLNLAKINAGLAQSGLAPVSNQKVKAQENAIKEEVYGKGPSAAEAAKASAEVEMAKVKANLSLLSDAIKTSDAIIGQALKDGNVTLDAAYAVRLANLQADTDAQRQALELDRAEVDKALTQARTTTERAPLLQQRVQIDAQLKLLDSSLREGTRQLGIWKTEQEKQLANITAKVRVEVANLTGKFDRSAVEAQLKAQFEGEYKAAATLPTAPEQTGARNNIDMLVKAGVAQAEFNAKLGEAQRLQSQLAVQEEAIRTQAAQGYISQTEAEARLVQARAMQVPALQSIVDKLREMRDAMPADAAAAIDQMSASIGQLDNTVKAATPAVVDLGTKLKNTAIDGLADAAASAMTNFSNLGDMVKGTLRQMAADILRSGVKSALRQAFSMDGGGGGGGGSGISSFFSGVKALFGFAEGGHIRGPGTGTSDSIPALINGTTPIAVSNNEFIQPEKAVNKYGLGFMEAVRTLQFPKPQFAFGGLVQAHQRARFATGGQVSGAAAGNTPNVSIQFTNTGTPQRVTDQSQQFNGKDMIVRVMLADLAINGPIAQGMRATRGR